MKTVKKKIVSTIIGKDTYDLIFTKIDKVIIEHNGLEIKKDNSLDHNYVLFIATLLLIEEVNKMYSICEDKEDKDMLKRAIIKLYQRVNGGANNGYNRSKGRSNKKYPKN